MSFVRHFDWSHKYRHTWGGDPHGRVVKFSPHLTIDLAQNEWNNPAPPPIKQQQQQQKKKKQQQKTKQKKNNKKKQNKNKKTKQKQNNNIGNHF